MISFYCNSKKMLINHLSPTPDASHPCHPSLLTVHCCQGAITSSCLVLSNLFPVPFLFFTVGHILICVYSIHISIYLLLSSILLSFSPQSLFSRLYMKRLSKSMSALLSFGLVACFREVPGVQGYLLPFSFYILPFPS